MEQFRSAAFQRFVRLWRTCILLILVLGASRASALTIIRRAPDVQGIELKVAWAPLVVRGVVTSHRAFSVEGESFNAVDIRVAETLRGPVKPGQTVAVTTRNVNALPWFENGRIDREYLFFLITGESVVSERTPTPGQAVIWRQRPWAIPDYSHNAPVPLFGDFGTPLFAYTSRDYAARLEDHAAALAAFRAEAAAAVKYGAGHIGLVLNAKPNIAPLPGELQIPVDPRGPEVAARLAKSADAVDRFNACNVLEHFKSDQSIALLKSMLDDRFIVDDPYWPDNPYWDFDLGQGKWKIHPYRVRQRAWGILQKWKAAPTRAILGQFHYRPAVVKPGWYVAAAVVLAIPSTLR